MTSLREIQQQFMGYLLEDDKKIVENVSAKDAEFIQERLAIYGDAYRLRLIDILRDEYLACACFFGEERFSTLLYNYIDAYPSKSFSVRFLGEHLSEYFVKCNEHFASELAAFEWMMSLTGDALDSHYFNRDDLNNMPHDQWAYLQFSIHPAVFILPCYWNVVDYWGAVTNELEAISPQKNASPTTWMIWRNKAYESFYRPLNQAQRILFQAIKNQQNFGTICEVLCENLPEEEVAEFALRNILRWIDDGVLSKV